MSRLIVPDNYCPLLDLQQTEKAIKLLKDFFESNLSSELQLRRVTAPLFVLRGTGVNDELNSVERPVSFPIKDMDESVAEVVHSLAKWKRMMLADYSVMPGYGLYTDMNAIRADEEMDNVHSLYVDQWDWEMTLAPGQRTIEMLKKTVTKIFNVFKRTEYFMFENYPQLTPMLPDEITFIHAQELLDRYPGLSVKERENEFTKEYGAIFIIGIGGALSDGLSHDGRAADYDDWTTPDEKGLKGLNGDILVWNPVLNRALELSSMGIRVDKEGLINQLAIRGQEDRLKLMFHQRLLNGELPLSMGGGIGQSRLCLQLLRKVHIGETQSSVWPESMRIECAKVGIPLI